MEIRQIKYDETLTLRHNILRPDLTREECVYPGDTDSTTYHFGCFMDNQHVGIVSIYNKPNPEVHEGNGFQIRAMATCDSVRNKGIGLKLLHTAEDMAFNSGAHYLWANARTSALGFYKKAGYRVCGTEFTIAGVGPHYMVCLPRR